MIERCDAKLIASNTAVKEFMSDGIGLSVHWGLYSILGRGEWVMHTEKIPAQEYKMLMKSFNPVSFNADEWIFLIKQAGIKAFMITSKHHDGFCMFDSKYTDFKITNTQFGRDPMKDLSKACDKYDVKLHFYYSLLDWYHPDYQTNWKRYVEYYQNQIKELCTNYGRLGGILFDGWWPRFPFGKETEHFRPKGEWAIAQTYDLIHSLQPDALVTNNHHILPLPGEDYQIFEIDMPGENTTGFNTTEIGDKPVATWITFGKGWSYIKQNKEFKTAQYIFNHIRRCKEKNVFLWLNACPLPDGRFQPEEIEILEKLKQLPENV